MTKDLRARLATALSHEGPEARRALVAQIADYAITGAWTLLSRRRAADVYRQMMVATIVLLPWDEQREVMRRALLDWLDHHEQSEHEARKPHAHARSTIQRVIAALEAKQGTP